MNIEQRQEEFDLWVSSIDERISQWKETIPNTVSNKLNGLRPNSLIELEKYIIERYDNYQVFLDDNFAYNAALSYAGEIFKISFGYAEWYMELRQEYNDKNSQSYAKPGILIKSQPVIILNFWSAFSAKKRNSLYTNFTLSNRLLAALTGELKYEDIYGQNATDYWKEIKGLAVEKQSNFIDKGRSYEHLILFTQSNLQLFEMANLAKSIFDKQTQSGLSYQFVNNDYFKLRLQSGYEFHFRMDRSKHIIEESKEMAADHKGCLDKAKIGQCAARIDFWGDGDDMLYFYELGLILQAFSDRTKFFIYDLHQGFLE